MVALITSIKSLFYNFTNFLIGKTAFFVILFGWFLIITGLIFLFRPEQARANMVRRGLGTIKWALSFVLIYTALLILSLAGRISGFLSAAVSVGTIVGLIWLYFYLTNKSLNILKDKIAMVPIRGLRTYAIIQVIIGILMVTLQRRFW